MVTDSIAASSLCYVLCSQSFEKLSTSLSRFKVHQTCWTKKQSSIPLSCLVLSCLLLSLGYSSRSHSTKDALLYIHTGRTRLVFAKRLHYTVIKTCLHPNSNKGCCSLEARMILPCCSLLQDFAWSFHISHQLIQSTEMQQIKDLPEEICCVCNFQCNFDSVTCHL